MFVPRILPHFASHFSPRADPNRNPQGYFPGENRYKDPIRPDASFAIMQEEAKVMAELNEDPKMSVTGKPGNL